MLLGTEILHTVAVKVGAVDELLKILNKFWIKLFESLFMHWLKSFGKSEAELKTELQTFKTPFYFYFSVGFAVIFSKDSL